MIRVRNLVVTRSATVICRLAELEVQRGEHVCITGKNGSGKSTLLRVLAGLERDFSGTVSVTAALRERTLVHQEPLLLRGTVLTNVLYGLKARGIARREALRKAHAWLERGGLGGLGPRRCQGLSGGERRRVALVRAFVIEPELLLLDEPLSDLDSVGARMLAEVLRESNGLTVCMTSPKGEAAALVDRTVTLDS